jgi:hypothetical protein
VGQLRGGQGIDLEFEVVAHAPNGARARVDGLGLKALEFEVPSMGAVRAAKGFRKTRRIKAARMRGQGQTPDKLMVNMPHN